MEYIITGFVLGVLGSFHCLGMCGPLALSLPVQQFQGSKKWASILLYNSGRVLTYGLLGITIGAIGEIFSWWGLQQMLSILAGVVLLVLLFSRFSVVNKIRWMHNGRKWVQLQLGKTLAMAKSPASFLVIGILNGLLPCGLVYAAITASLATMDTMHGMIIMISFGLGTFPMMIGILYLNYWIKGVLKQKMNRVIPAVVAGLALLLILRGMNLDIPYLSPKANLAEKEVSCCHRPQ